MWIHMYYIHFLRVIYILVFSANLHKSASIKLEESSHFKKKNWKKVQDNQPRRNPSLKLQSWEACSQVNYDGANITGFHSYDSYRLKQEKKKPELEEM
jgi:hypothetical protein